MTPQQLQRAEELFHRLRHVPAHERTALLDKACGDDREVRDEVAEILAHADPDKTMTELRERISRLMHVQQTMDRDVPGRFQHPKQVGPFKILEVLGEGGMGTVYLAEQEHPVRRRVALKIIKIGMDTSEVVARFEAERQALALMNHPNIPKVFEAGATEQGRPYFVMEHVPGLPITEYCDKHRLTTRERLELLIQVCGAVQHAHQKAVIHRDVKPSNILVTVQDGKPVPKIIDFGVAKAIQQRLTERTLFTEQGRLIGTPEYMSPEQAEMTALDVDTRTDIYSMGVILYELLVGALPFDPTTLRKGGFAEIQRIIREQEPQKPSTKLSSLGDASAIVAEGRHTDRSSLVKQLRGDLDWITLKAMEKDRTRRYASAAALAEDIARHLRHEPVLAGPPNAAYRVRKFVRRNRGAVAAAGAIALILIGATAVSIGFARSANEQRRTAVAAEEDQRRARAEAEQSRDNLEAVVNFQSSMLGDIDAERMGLGIIDDLRDSIREALEATNASSEAVEQAIASFDLSLEGVNPTNLALKVVDEHVLSRAVETIEEDFADQAVVRAALYQTVADTYREIGLYEPATPLQEAAMRTRRQELGDEHPSTLASINSMGLLLWSMGKYEEAMPYYREALQGQRRVQGDDHPDTLGTLNNMALLLQTIGKYDEALPYQTEVVERKRRVLGNDHRDTLLSIRNMGSLLKSMGKLREAEEYYREALAGNRRILGSDHPETLSSIHSMGQVLWTMGKYEEAMPYHLEALEGNRRVLGDDHPKTMASINNMGNLFLMMGRPGDAEPYHRETLATSRRVLGDDHPQTLGAMNNLGVLLQSLGKLEEAHKLYVDVLDGCRRILGDDHPNTVGSRYSVGIILVTMGKPSDAEPHLAAAVDGARRAMPPGHWQIGVFLGGYARCLTALGRYSDAEKALDEAYGILEPAVGAEHIRTVNLVESLVELYDAWHADDPGAGHDAKAAEWRAKLPMKPKDEPEPGA